MVFAAPLRQYYLDGTTRGHLSGLIHLDNFIMTRKLSSVYRDFAKTHANPDTDGNSPYHRAVMGNSANHVTVNLDNFVIFDSSLLPRKFRYQRN
jgi:hypothetical protein